MKHLITACLFGAAAACAQPIPKPTIVQAVVRAAGLEARIMWMDGSGNLDNLDTPAKVAAVMEHCRRANINTVVVDVKPLIGEVLYPSKLATRLSTYRGKQYDPTYDLLATALEEGHKRGLKVYAGLNVFSEGHKLIGRGLAYSKPDWQAVCNVSQRSIVTDDGAYPVSSLNDPPGTDALAAYTPDYGNSRSVKPGETYAVVSNNTVEALMSSDAVEENSITIPDDGELLVGIGAAGNWMAEHLLPGASAAWDETDSLQPILQVASERVSVFVNPIAPEPRAHELGIIKEIATNYPVDGVVFDRMRYSGLTTDFSDLSRKAFEQWAGIRLRNWPGDIYGYSADPVNEAIRGPYYRRWLEWRARNIREFAREATTTVRTARPTAKCAVYVGSWYPVYYGVGVNWASDEYNAAYDWMTDKYYQSGYAPLMDWLCTGTYYPEPFRASAVKAGRDPDATVEAGAELSNSVVNDAAYVYASLSVSDFMKRTPTLIQAVQAARQESQGVMFFDLSYVIDGNLWPVLEQAFPNPAIAPHDVPELLTRIKDVRTVLPETTAKPHVLGTQNWKLVVPE